MSAQDWLADLPTTTRNSAEPPTHLIRIPLSSNQRGSPCALTTQPFPRNPGQPPRPALSPVEGPTRPPSRRAHQTPRATKCNRTQPNHANPLPHLHTLPFASPFASSRHRGSSPPPLPRATAFSPDAID